ncbi:protein psiM [Exaiptasia diaphana]|uniref:Uncharacterized protein n=1 Tax=Exaiptasia diaphana TaxID=2652724 RepID=A0A913XUQ2_EXADI|nr:protein psiM [Exaiptasia diaphana]KXJ09014.1 hypothetical protein AC249_AIPGENE13964 [Exaiptasia diaphana]
MKCFVIVFIVMAVKWSAAETSCQNVLDCKGTSDGYQNCCVGKCVYHKFCDGYCSHKRHCAPNENCISYQCSKDEQDCRYPYECSGSYKNCCNNKCVGRRYCDEYCSRKSDCSTDEYCISNKCSKSKPFGYCDSENTCEHYLQFCSVNNKCEYCDCAKGEKCGTDGKCQTKDSMSFSPASIAGLAAVVVIGSCIACGIYCGCARRIGRQPRAQLQLPASRQDVSLNVVPDAEAVETPASPPILPGGPPPYHSLERLDVTEEPPPPSYEEAVRNSHKNLSAA